MRKVGQNRGLDQNRGLEGSGASSRPRLLGMVALLASAAVTAAGMEPTNAIRRPHPKQDATQRAPAALDALKLPPSPLAADGSG